MISIDILGPFHETTRRNRYIIIAEDVFTKWVEAAAVPIADATTVIRFLEPEIFARYGYPRTIISDNAKIFQGNRYVRSCQAHGINVYYSPVYHQQSNPVERRVQELKKVLRALLFNQQRRYNWDLHLSRALHVLRGRQNAATGISPSEALLGYKLPREGEWEIPQYLEERRRRVDRPTRLENIRRRQLDFHHRWYDVQRRPQVTFQDGQRVMTREGAPLKSKFSDAWTGPYVIVTRLSPEVYQVEKNGAVVNIHVDDLRVAPTGNRNPERAGIAPEEPGNHAGNQPPIPVNTDEGDGDEGELEGGPAEPAMQEEPGLVTREEIAGPPMMIRGRRVRLVAR